MRERRYTPAPLGHAEKKNSGVGPLHELKNINAIYFSCYSVLCTVVCTSLLPGSRKWNAAG